MRRLFACLVVGCTAATVGADGTARADSTFAEPKLSLGYTGSASVRLDAHGQTFLPLGAEVGLYWPHGYFALLAAAGGTSGSSSLSQPGLSSSASTVFRGGLSAGIHWTTPNDTGPALIAGGDISVYLGYLSSGAQNAQESLNAVGGFGGCIQLFAGFKYNYFIIDAGPLVCDENVTQPYILPDDRFVTSQEGNFGAFLRLRWLVPFAAAP